MDFLESLISQIDKKIDSRVVIGPKIGEDAAVIDFGDRYLVAKTDPITFTTDEIGWYLVCVNSNDIATMGAVPKWLLLSMLLPELKTTEKLVQQIFDQVLVACREFGISLCGGHTEVTYGLDRPIVIGQMLGEVRKERLVTSAGARVGDALLLTKGIGIEATSIIAREKEKELSLKYPKEFLQKAKNFLKKPGISVLKEALIAAEVGVHAMHDPTEGGIANAVNELALCSNVGAILRKDDIPVFPETLKLCADFQINPLGVISSGALLISAEPYQGKKIISALSEPGIPCNIIGKVLSKSEGVLIESEGERRPLEMFDSDEIAKIY